VVLEWWQGAALGGLGALSLEAVQVALYVQRHGHTPWRSRDRRSRADRYGQPLPRLPIFGLAVFLKSATGLVLVGALATGGQVTTPATALLLGAAATDLVRRGAQQVSLPDGTPVAQQSGAQLITLDKNSDAELSQP